MSGPTLPPARPLRAPVSLGCLAGAVAAAAAAGAGLLVAGIAESQSPTDAVGSAFIDRVPAWLKRLAIDWFGTANKTALRVGMFTVIVALAVVFGWAALRRRWVGAVGFAAFGLLGLLAVLDRPGHEGGSIAAAVVATLVGVTALWLLLDILEGRWRLANFPHRSRAVIGYERRNFLIGLGAVAAGAATGIGVGASLESRRLSRVRSSAPAALPPVAGASGPATPTTVRVVSEQVATTAVEAVEPYITPNKDFYLIDTALTVPSTSADEWEIKIHGLVERPTTLRYDDLLKRPQVERTITLSCVSNEIGGHLVGNAVWQGVLLADVLKDAGVWPEAEQVFTTSSDGWTCGFPVDAALDGRDALIAIGMNGEPLPLRHGFPVRLVVPGLYGYVSATKWLTDIKLTTWDADRGYWLDRGWSALGPVKPQSRIDLPRRKERVIAGPVVLGGVAWAHRRGVERVEVSIGDGPWINTELDTRSGIDTWRQWYYVWQAPVGKHRVRVRVIDGTGEVQTEEVTSPDPDGASGWHTRTITVHSS